MLFSPKQFHRQQGQTLIETLVAVFILVMGITAALGLATYSLKASTSISKQIIGMGLAREGIEAVKNMRDTNWLQTDLSDSCYDFYTTGDSANCYPDWLNSKTSGYNIDPGSEEQSYALWYDSTANDSFWHLDQVGTRYGLDYNLEDPQYGLYSARNTPTVTDATSDYGRKITLTPDTSFGPFSHADLGPRIKVTSQVWWKDKDCPVSDDVPSNSKCVITLETYLTNWKNY